MNPIRSAKFLALGLALVGMAPKLAQAQGATITGRVISDQGQPLAGANVFINELNISVGTNPAGNYTITIPQARLGGQAVILRARAIGYSPQSQQIRIAQGTQTVNFELRRELTQLSEVVVTGVTTATEQRKLAFTVTRVDSAMMPVAGSSPLAQLQGKVPGALIVSNSGRPGAAPAIMLRGPVSLNGAGRGQSPLFILDGVPLQGSLPDLNPDDIASVEVVKGAAAASVYGARAGAGVINITTKTGRHAQQGIRLFARTETGMSDIEGTFPLARYTGLNLTPDGTRFCSKDILTQAGANATSSAQSGLFSTCGRYIVWDDEVSRINNNADDFALSAQGFLGDFALAASPAFDDLTGVFMWRPFPEYRDPMGQALTSNAYVNTNLDMRGRVNNTGVFASVSNFSQQGAVTAIPGYTRNSGRANLDQTFGDKWSASFQSFFSQSTDHAAQLDADGAGSTSPWFTITRQSWMTQMDGRDQLGRYYVRPNPLANAAQNFNPLYGAAFNRRTDRSTRYVGGLTARYQPLSWLNFDGMFGYDRNQGQAIQMRDRGWRTTSSAPATASGFLGEEAFDNWQWNTTFSGTAQRQIFDELNAAFSTRFVYSDRSTFSNFLQGIDIAIPGLMTASAVTQNRAFGSTRTYVRDLGFFYGLDLDYKDRYILGGLVRRDASSLFGEGHRWQTFGRASAAWLVSSEPWWPAPQAMTLFKLRASRGQTGNRPSFSAQYTSFTLGTGGTLNPATIGNPNLKPEINTETEYGVDLEFFGRYGLNVSYARADIDNQILTAQPSVTSGFQRQWQNVGEITNRTWEATLNVPIITRGAFNWSSRLIWDQLRSEIARLDIPDFTGDITAGNVYTVFQYRAGERIGTVYGWDMVRACDQLPSSYVSQCSNSASDLGAAFRPNTDGFIAWFGAGNAETEGITRNLWRSYLSPADAPWQNRMSWGMPIIRRDISDECLAAVTCNATSVALGNGLPKYHWGMSHTVDWRRLSLYGLLDATYGQKMWNIAYHWSFGDLQGGLVDQYGKSVEEAKPVGYYWRRGPSNSPTSAAATGSGGLYDGLNPHGWSFEDASFVKLRELSANYRVGPVGGVGDWRVGLVGRNLKTWSDWRGFDPESRHSTSDFGTALLNPVNGFKFPNLRTFTLQLSSSF